jgi:uncharacterized protein
VDRTQIEDLDLTSAELRVLGCLVEKELTTPDQYPLTLNSLVLACNQRSNREPVLNLTEATVTAAVTSAKTKGLVRFVHPSHGRSAIRYGHVLGDALGVSQRQLALITVMILRGPQTPGELRTRTDRMAEFSDLQDLERELERLCGPEHLLVERMSRRAGQSQDRYRHLLGGASPEPNFEPSYPTREISHFEPRQAPTAGGAGPNLTELLDEVAAPRRELAELKEGLVELRRQLGE